MKLPNGDRAVVSSEKLLDYCLSTAHPRGRHKARLFAARTGISVADAGLLKAALLDAAAEMEAVARQRNAYGQLYEIRFPFAGPGGACQVLSVWLVAESDGIPRLVTAYPV
jgi:hypothetical protein